MINKEFPFTKKLIDGLQPAPMGKRDEYRDSKVKGLCLRVTDKCAMTFSVHRRVKNGRVQRITIGRYPAVSIEQARKKAMDYISMLASGISVADIHKQKRLEMTFGDLFGLYYSLHSTQNKRSHKDDKRHYEMYLKKAIGGRRLSEIDRTDIGNLHAYITAKGSKTAANRVVSLASSVFYWGINRGNCVLNPAARIKKNKEKSRDRYILRDEIPFFFKAVMMEENKVIADFVLMALFTGARRQNVMSMRWSDIDFDQKIWRIKQTKNGTPQQVALSIEAIGVLERRERVGFSDCVFPSDGKAGHLVEPKKGWMRILKRAGCLRVLDHLKTRRLLDEQATKILESKLMIDPYDASVQIAEISANMGVDIDPFSMDNLWIHDLRRTLGSWQATNGVSLSIIGKSLNHQSEATTKIYARFDMEPVRIAVSEATRSMVTYGVCTPIGTNQIHP